MVYYIVKHVSTISCRKVVGEIDMKLERLTKSDRLTKLGIVELGLIGGRARPKYQK